MSESKYFVVKQKAVPEVLSKVVEAKRLLESGELLGIPVLDHVVIGGADYVSFKESGYI